MPSNVSGVSISVNFFQLFLTFLKTSGILRFLNKFDMSIKPITTADRSVEHLWKGGRVVECTALERRHTEIPYRGFESLPFRQISKGRKLRLSAFLRFRPHHSTSRSSCPAAFPGTSSFRKRHQQFTKPTPRRQIRFLDSCTSGGPAPPDHCL